MQQLAKFAGLAFLLTLLTLEPLLADEETDESSQKCIHTRSIRSTQVVNDSNILFFSGKTVYQNTLPRQCRGLSREGRFSYRISGGRLCQLDSIRILYNGPTGLEEGFSCPLGYFRKITEDDVEYLLHGEPEPTEIEPLPPAEPEEIIKETDES